MDLFSKLDSLGVDTADALTRCVGNKTLLEKMYKKLPATINPVNETDPSLEVLEFIDSGDIETAKKNAHALKGLMGNLSITPLFRAYTEILDFLRAEKLEQAKEILLSILPIQNEIIEAIKTLE